MTDDSGNLHISRNNVANNYKYSCDQMHRGKELKLTYIRPNSSQKQKLSQDGSASA